MKSRIRWLTIGAVVFFMAGLAPRSAFALNGNINFGASCSAEERTKLTEAMRIAVDQVVTNPEPMQACLKDAVLSGSVASPNEGDVTSPEVIIARLAENMPTTIDCVELGTPGVNDRTQATVGPERITVDHDWLSMSTTLDTASLLLHTIGFNKGYVTPGGIGEEHSYSVNNQLFTCSQSINIGRVNNGAPLPHGVPRSSAASGETTLAQVGAEGGVPNDTTSCLSMQFAAGVFGRAGSFVDALGLTCKPLGDDTADDSLRAFGGGGTPFQQRCAAGELMVGAWGRAGGFVDAIGPLCEREEAIRPTNLTSFRRDPVAGGPGGVAWERRCPNGMAVKAIRTRTGAFVDRLELVCQTTIASAQSVETTVLPLVGGLGGTKEYLEICTGRAVLGSLVVLSSADGIDRLAGYCANVGSAPSGAAIVPAGRLAHFLPGHGGSGGSETIDACQPGGALVGIAVGKDGWARTVQGICTNDASAWSTGSPQALSLLERRGSDATSFQATLCPSRSFLVGWKIKTGQFVDSVQPQCRSFTAGMQGPLPPTTPGPDLGVEITDCRGGLAFVISNGGDQGVEGVTWQASFNLRADAGGLAGSAQTGSLARVDPGGREPQSASLPEQCTNANVPIEQRGCVATVQVFRATGETNIDNNIADRICSP